MVLFGYIAKIYAHILLRVLLLTVGIIFLFDFIDLLRVSERLGGNLSLVLQMAWMKNYIHTARIVPFIVFAAGMLTYAKLTKSYELVSARALGFSLWRLLWPAVVVTFIFSLFFITVINPIGAVSYVRYDRLEMKHLKQQSGFLAPSSTGLWLKDKVGDNKYIINILRLEEGTNTLHDINIFVFNGSTHRFGRKYEAATAHLTDNGWVFPEVLEIDRQNNQRYLHNFTMPTNISLHKIQEGLVPPEAVSLWNLPYFISMIKESGISANKYIVYFCKLAAMPFLNIAMLMLGVAFIPRHPRFTQHNWLVAVGLAAGFCIYFLIDISTALATAGTMPTWAAALMPLLITCLLACIVLLHREEGR